MCLALDGILFNISENKKSLYFDNKSEYEKRYAAKCEIRK
jgi:hypothetical protein